MSLTPKEEQDHLEDRFAEGLGVCGDCGEGADAHEVWTNPQGVIVVGCINDITG